MTKLAAETLVTRLGVCIATSGPGGVHPLTGMQETGLLGTGYQQEVHLERLYEDVAEYDVLVTQAFLRGQPHKVAIATTLFKDKIGQLGS